MGRIRKNHAQCRAELASRDQSNLLLPDCRTLGWRLILPFVANRDFPAGSIHQVQPRANRPAAFLEFLSAVVVSVDGPGGQKIGQARQGLRPIVLRRCEHSLLRGAVGSGCSRQVAGRRIKKRRLIGEQFESQRRFGASGHMCAEPDQCRLGEPFR